jgi:dihydroneopterin aldolase/2-amino-4-hydroxy-6-hydroxymethyldihydropteridine diphosphokinase
MDTIELRGLRVVGTHGALAFEREQAQPFEVDVVIDADLSRPAASDALDDTIDYGRVAEIVAAVVAGETNNLLERLGARIADAVLAMDARVVRVHATIWKLRPPVPVDLDRAGVTIVRDRA